MLKQEARWGRCVRIGACGLALGVAGSITQGDAKADGIEHFFAAEELAPSSGDAFVFETTFTNPTPPGPAPFPIATNPDDGQLFFFDSANTDVLIRMLDQGGAPSALTNWMFFGSRTTVAVSRTVTNTNTMRVEVKSGIITPGGFQTSSRSSFRQAVVVRNTTAAPIDVGVNFTGSHDAAGVFPDGGSTRHSFSVDVNNGEPGFIDFTTQGHFNSFSPNFNSSLGNLFPVGITRPEPGRWAFDEDAAGLVFDPLTEQLAPGEEATIFLVGSVENVITNNGSSLASYDGFNTTIFDFELSNAGLQVVAFVPEPGSLALLGVMSLGMLWRRRAH